MASLMDSVMAISAELAAVTVSGTAARSADLVGQGAWAIARLVSTTDCYITTDESDATTAKTFLPANQIEYFKVPSGNSISVIQKSAGGTLNITNMV